MRGLSFGRCIMENLRWASPVRCSGLCRIRRSSLVLVNGKSQVTGLRWWSGVPPMHTPRAFKPIRWELGCGSLHFIPNRRGLGRTSPRGSDGDKSAVSPGMNRSPIRETLGQGSSWSECHVVTKSSGGETEGIKSRRMRRGAITTIASCLRMRRKPAPAWGARNPDKLNFFSAAYNELLALLSPDLRASDWPCAQVPGFDTFQIRFFLRG